MKRDVELLMSHANRPVSSLEQDLLHKLQDQSDECVEHAKDVVGSLTHGVLLPLLRYVCWGSRYAASAEREQIAIKQMEEQIHLLRQKVRYSS